MRTVFVLIFMTALGAIVFLQSMQLGLVKEELASYRARTEELEDQRLRGDAAMYVLQQVVLRNQRAIKSMKPRRVLTVTAYSPRPSETDSTPYHTATNSPVRNGIVAVSRDLFNQGWVFGKKVYIKNHGVFIIDDLMAERKRNQVDIFMHDTKAAVKFGRKELECYLLDLKPMYKTAAMSDVM